MSRLNYGEQFPVLEVPAVGGGMISLPGDLAGSYGVVLMYRGSWCPYCNAQLGAFSRAVDTLTEVGAKVVALSVDDEETSAALVDKRKLRFPVGHSADADKIAAATGAYVNDDPHYLQSTGFILAPDGTVRLAVYSSGAIGRLVADDVIGFIRYVTEHPAAR
ncbi:peroxiredoxin family protein [Mycobacterium helveticum]|uniref:thioredoxin-dependent peroxiredoxin n=1 Tax=Mycobacterium helveticum TaxID=2592811 RepID=A0A557XST1_9MYCO|nr:peroxiredoxin family protein [Mycobacterium helveticum]TVS83033.1 peroxiredoxin family protein [Mycobacterium helveticum]TVS89018.1 peroxiredoxin family protein [Mycobacterium helveticum]